MSIREALSTVPDLNEEQVSALETVLLAREDAMADVIRLAGAQFGMYPEIVAEVLAQVGFGTPPSEEERQMIRSQFVALMERLTQQFRDGQ